MNLYEFVPDSTLPLPEDRRADDELRQQLASFLSLLKPREERIIRLRFGIDTGEEHTLKEIGNKIELTRERVRQIQEHTLQKLRKMVLARGLESLL